VALTKTFIREAREPGKYRDEENIYLVIPARRPAGGSWQFIYSFKNQPRAMGLGGRGRDVGAVRQAGRDARGLLERGIDPLEARAEAALLAEAEQARRTKFAHAAEAYIASHEAGWKSAKHAGQWRATLATYAYPVIGELAVGEITTDHLLRILNPIWRDKAETASRVRGRVELILDYVKARGWREGENVAAWRGHLALMLPAKAKVAPVVHHAALDWREAPAFLARLRTQAGMGARALEFAILTSCRSGEVRLAAWDEIDLEAKVWTVPATRMKTGREHRVPLSAAALALLERVKASRELSTLAFPGARAARPLSDMTLTAVLRRMKRGELTAHGFRSSFRDWAGETGQPHDIAEAALAHTLGNKTQLAYQRGDLLARRRALMDEWSAYLAMPAKSEKPQLRSGEMALAAE
jgi:integrase